MVDLTAALDEVRRTGNLPQWAETIDLTTAAPELQAAVRLLQGLSAQYRIDSHQAIADLNAAIEHYGSVRAQTPGGRIDDVHNELYGVALDALGTVFGRSGDWQRSIFYHRRALLWAEKTGSYKDVTLSASKLGLQFLRCFRATDAAHLLYRLRPGSANETLVFRDNLHRNLMAVLYFACGRLNEAERACHPDDEDRISTDHRVLVAARAAVLAVNTGDLPKAAKRLAVLDSIPAGPKDKVEAARTAATARYLGAVGETDRALERLDELDRDFPSRIFENITHPLLVRLGVLFDAGRYREVVDLAEGELTANGEQLAVSNAPIIAHVLDHQARALAGLNNWGQALVARRRAEDHRRRFDIDSEQYTYLTLLDGGQNAASINQLQLADRYARCGRFRDVFGHDLRNILSTIQLLNEDAANVETSELAEKLDRLEFLLGRMEHTRENAQAYVTLVDPESRQADLADRASTGPTSVGHEIDEILESYTTEAGAKNITLVRAGSPQVSVALDGTMLRAIVTNLVGNAIKFSHFGTRVEIGWVIEETGNGNGETGLCITVRDGGPGLTSQDIDNIFRNVSALSARPTNSESSTGIGLQIVFGFTEALGGRFQASSHPDGGAVFCVRLPGFFQTGDLPLLSPRQWVPSRSPEPTGRHIDSDSVSVAILRAVVADDDPLMGSVMTSLLETLGVETRRVCSVETAIGALEGLETIDLFITDVMFDGSPTGFELADRAAALHPNATVVICSGFDVDKADVSDNTILLHKPVRLESLEGVLRNRSRRRFATGASCQPARSYPDEQGRIRLLNEVAKGRSIPLNVFQTMMGAADPGVRVEALIMASIIEAIDRNWDESLTLGRRANELIAKHRIEQAPQFRWQLSNNIGMILHEMGRYEEAKTEFETTLQWALDCGFTYGAPRSAVNLAWSLIRLEQIEEAIELLGRAITWIGADQAARAKLFAALGEILRRQGAMTLAVMLLQGALGRFSSIEVDDIRRTLLRLARAYAEMGSRDDLGVIVARLERLAFQFSSSPTDEAIIASIHAAILLDDGDVDQALVLAERSFDQLTSHGEINESGQIALAALVEGLTRNRQWEPVAQRFADLDSLPSGIRTPSILSAVGLCCEKAGQAKAAYEYETAASRLRAQKNVGLPTLIQLAQTLSAVAEPDYVSAATTGWSPWEDRPESAQLAASEIAGFACEVGDALDRARQALRAVRDRLGWATPDMTEFNRALEQLAASVAEPDRSSPHSDCAAC